MTWQADEWKGAHGAVMREPLQQPRVLVEDFLLASWRAHRWGHLRKTRAHYRPVTAPDVAAVAASLQVSRPADQQGALRAALTGSVVTQHTARHWRGGTAQCPHCPHPDETWAHRFWECGRWSEDRRQADVWQPPRDASVRAAGIPEVHPRLWAARLAAEAFVLQPWPVVGFAVAWLDGSAVDPTDALLRRAGWA